MTERVCVYYPSDNAEGYIWESILPSEKEAFLSQGWFATPDLSDNKQKDVLMHSLPYALRKTAKPVPKNK